jgi:hypothetical protein
MNQVASLTWFARHELNLAWRDWIGLMSGGRKLKDRAVLIGMAVFALALHGVAYAVLSPFFKAGGAVDIAALVMISGMLVLTFTMMLSQAMESVTRAFYSRDDLDLILSSPASSRDLFAVRIAMMALTTAGMSGLMVAPFINVAAMLGGAQWLAGYGIVFAISFLATGAAVLIALALFRTVGAKRTRLVAQIAAAVVGASFLIGIQVVAIVSYGSMSRWSVINSQTVIDNAPAIDSLFWLPAFAATGSLGALVFVLVLSIVFFAFAAHTGATQFQRIVLSALSVSTGNVRQKRSQVSFGATSTHRYADAQGMDAAQPRSVAYFANADAGALSHSASPHAVGELWRGRPLVGHSGTRRRDGHRTARRWLGVADDLRRRRSRFGRNRTGHSVRPDVGEGASRARCRPGDCVTAGCWYRRVVHLGCGRDVCWSTGGRTLRHRHSTLVPRAIEALQLPPTSGRVKSIDILRGIRFDLMCGHGGAGCGGQRHRGGAGHFVGDRHGGCVADQSAAGLKARHRRLARQLVTFVVASVPQVTEVSAH